MHHFTVARLHAPKWTSSAHGGSVPPKKEQSWLKRRNALGKRSFSEVGGPDLCQMYGSVASPGVMGFWLFLMVYN